jgi:hypothetical protein
VLVGNIPVHAKAASTDTVIVVTMSICGVASVATSGDPGVELSVAVDRVGCMGIGVIAMTAPWSDGTMTDSTSQLRNSLITTGVEGNASTSLHNRNSGKLMMANGTQQSSFETFTFRVMVSKDGWKSAN